MKYKITNLLFLKPLEKVKNHQWSFHRQKKTKSIEWSNSLRSREKKNRKEK
jgi:hypothetical protein